MEHGNEISSIKGDKQSRLVRLNPDGVLVIIGCKNDQIFIWDWQNYDVAIKCIILPAFTTMEIACDKNMIYTCSRNNEVCQIDLRSLRASTISQGPNPKCTSMVILPDGEAILSGITTYSVFIYWELSSWREIQYNAGTVDYGSQYCEGTLDAIRQRDAIFHFLKANKSVYNYTNYLYTVAYQPAHLYQKCNVF